MARIEGSIGVIPEQSTRKSSLVPMGDIVDRPFPFLGNVPAHLEGTRNTASQTEPFGIKLVASEVIAPAAPVVEPRAESGCTVEVTTIREGGWQTQYPKGKIDD
jgi:hypothetical protein